MRGRRGAAWAVPLLMLAAAAGCGEAAEERRFTPLGAPQAAEPSAPAAEASPRAAGTGRREPDEAAGRPRAVPRFPNGFRVAVETTGQTGAHPAVQRLEEFFQVWWYAVATSGRDTRYRSYLTTESFLRGTKLFHDVVHNWRKERVQPIGEVRFYDIRASERDGAVVVTACGDETGVGTKDVDTGEERWTYGKQRGAVYAIYLSMVQDGGEWRMRSYRAVGNHEPSGKRCR